MDVLTQHSCLVFFVLSKENVMCKPNKNSHFHAGKVAWMEKKYFLCFSRMEILPFSSKSRHAITYSARKGRMLNYSDGDS